MRMGRFVRRRGPSVTPRRCPFMRKAADQDIEAQTQPVRCLPSASRASGGQIYYSSTASDHKLRRGLGVFAKYVVHPSALKNGVATQPFNQRRPRMKLHRNASTPSSRLLFVRRVRPKLVMPRRGTRLPSSRTIASGASLHQRRRPALEDAILAPGADHGIKPRQQRSRIRLCGSSTAAAPSASAPHPSHVSAWLRAVSNTPPPPVPMQRYSPNPTPPLYQPLGCLRGRRWRR